MTIRTLLVSVLAVTTVACGASTTDAPKPAERLTADPDVPPDAEAGTVVIEPGMMRDLRVTTGPVESRVGGDRITLLGELGVNQGAYAEVGVPLAARVTRVLVNAGDVVERGTILMELTSPELGRARADYLSADARLALATASLDRKRGLAAERIVPVREVQEAESELAAAHATVRSARATIAAFGEGPPQPGDTDEAITSTFVLRAPVTGAVLERNVAVGQSLDPGATAFRIADLSTLWLIAHAFERDAVRIARGEQARLAFTALPGDDFTGTVQMVGREVHRESRTVDVRIDVRNTGSRLRPGMTATASLPAGAAGARILTVPVGAVQRVRDQWCVFIPKAEGTFEIRRIGRGRDLDGEVEVLSGLEGGESIVVEGAFLLKAEADKGAGGHEAH